MTFTKPHDSNTKTSLHFTFNIFCIVTADLTLLTITHICTMSLIFFTYTSQKALVVFSDCETRKQKTYWGFFTAQQCKPSLRKVSYRNSHFHELRAMCMLSLSFYSFKPHVAVGLAKSARDCHGGQKFLNGMVIMHRYFTYFETKSAKAVIREIIHLSDPHATNITCLPIMAHSRFVTCLLAAHALGKSGHNIHTPISTLLPWRCTEPVFQMQGAAQYSSTVHACTYNKRNSGIPHKHWNAFAVQNQNLLHCSFCYSVICPAHVLRYVMVPRSLLCPSSLLCHRLHSKVFARTQEIRRTAQFSWRGHDTVSLARSYTILLTTS